jgi:hypothetical protein
VRGIWDRASGFLARQSGRPNAAAIEAAAQTAAAQKPEARKPDETVKLLRDIRWELQEQRKYMEVFRHLAARDVLTEVGDFTDKHQLSFEETLDRITTDRVSFARFGDGEFRTMLRPDFNLRFQPWSPNLAKDLRSVLAFEDFDSRRLMLGFPYPYRNLHWSGVWLDIWHEVKPLLSPSLTYGNSHVSRPIFFQQTGDRGVELWRQVWADQDVCVVTGEGSRFELVPQLFDNVRSSSFEYSTPVNAYADLPRLMAALEAGDPDRLHLVSLGPAGTLVTAWLSRMGRWAIDIGHISDSWANVFASGQWPESLDVRRK